MSSTEEITIDEYHALLKKQKQQPETKTDYKAILEQQMELAGVPCEYEREFRFARPRQWRFDYAWASAVSGFVALEYEGMAYRGGKSGHTTIKGYENNCEKYNAAAVRGWKVLRVTAKMVEDGRALTALLEAFGLDANVPRIVAMTRPERKRRPSTRRKR